MKEQVISILKEGISDIEKVKRQYPTMRTQDVLDALRRLEDRINELTIPVVSQQRELLEAYTQFLWTQHNNLTDADNNKLALEKFIASYSG